MKRNPILFTYLLGLFGLSLCLGACNNSRYSEIKQLAQQALEPYKEIYVIALQTGIVKLPKGGNPHIIHPSAGGLDTPINNVWLVNGGYMGEVYECRGCDSCMTYYQKAGLISYQVKTIEKDSVIANVQLTEKGTQYLIENHISEPQSILNAWRRRLHIEMIMVAREKFDIHVHPTDTPLVYKCKAVRSLELTPFIEAIGGTKKDRNKDYAYSFKLNCRDTKLPIISNKETIPL